MSALQRFDSASRAALSNNRISYSEARSLAQQAKQAVAQSGNPKSTAAAVFRRLDAWAQNRAVQDARAVRTLARAVEDITQDGKTFTALGVRAQQQSTSRSSSRRASGGEAPRRASGGESGGSRRYAGGEGPSAPSRPSRRYSGGESAPSRRYSGGESSYSPSYNSYTPRYSGGE